MTTETLGDKLPREIERVRDCIRVYDSIGPAGAFASAMLQDAVKRAERAMLNCDVVEMIRSYKELEECE